MRVIIAGGRDMLDAEVVRQAIKRSEFKVTEVVCGGAPGVDMLGAAWAVEQGLPVAHFPAEWEKYGRASGPIRNRQMAEYADALIAIPTGGPGTENMIKVARELGLEVFVWSTRPTVKR